MSKTRHHVDGTTSIVSQLDDPLMSVRDVADLPGRRHFEATERPARIISLHLARLHAAVDNYAAEQRSKAAGEQFVDWDTPLATAVGESDLLMDLNLLEGANIVTVGELLTCFDENPGYLTSIPSMGVTRIANMLAAVLRHSLGR